MLGKDEITVFNIDGKSFTKKFIPISFFDLPVEYISEDGNYYLLWITDDENDEGEWWYITETNVEEILKYLKGKISPRDIIDKGKTFIGFRYYNDYFSIKNLSPLEEKLNDGFLTDEEMPSYDYRLNMDEKILRDIINELELNNDRIKNININLEDKIETYIQHYNSHISIKNTWAFEDMTFDIEEKSVFFKNSVDIYTDKNTPLAA